ncbi:hypothetical protein MLD38_030978 [Melastoma candidum]|uniref:Uncharacterized protein n=1 Tax=Melastoma candidum TaxID=119954 RepID=A0ACB9MNB5_9MYRT|nr:hypothetical protein MLD38_030978 [Melastoma candidum]
MGPPSIPYRSFLRKTNLPASAEDMELCIFDAEKYFNEAHDLEMFDSRRHFLTRHDPAAAPPRLSSALSSTDTYGRNCRIRSFRSFVTPTVSSEASWNSQTSLLSNPSGSVLNLGRDASCEMKRGKASPRWQRFRTTCPCLGKKSVSISERSLSSEPRQPNGHVPRATNDVGQCESMPQNSITQLSSCNEEISSSILTSRHSFSSEAENHFPSEIRCQQSSIIAGRPFSDATTVGFTFPNLKQSISSAAKAHAATTSPSSPPIKKLLDGSTISSQSPTNATMASTSVSLVDLPWESPDVFQPSEGVMHPRPKNQILIHQPTKNQFFAVPPLKVSVPGRKNVSFPIDIDDAVSDASSDLFEIESFTTQSTTYPNHSSATTPHAMMESMYEPSEASVTWSVTTAEGPLGDKGSVVTSYSVSASDVEEFTRLQLRLHRELELRGNSTGQGGNFKVVESGKRRSTSNTNSGGFLSCRSEKAVNVGPSPVNLMQAGENSMCRQGHNKSSTAGGGDNTYTTVPSSLAAAEMATGVPTRGSMLKNESSRGPQPISKNGACHSARVSITFAT